MVLQRLWVAQLSATPQATPLSGGEPFGDFPNLCDVDLPRLGPLGINWISPGYQYDMDWDMMPNNVAASSQAHSAEKQTSQVSITGVQLAGD